MKPVHGQVTINETPSKSKLFRFCEKKIDQWLETHLVESGLSNPAEFRVSFTEDDSGEASKQVSCVTEILMGETVFRGCDVDVDTQAAFLHSLKRLHSAHASV